MVVVRVIPRTNSVVSMALCGALAIGVAATGWTWMQDRAVETVVDPSPIPTAGLPHKGASPDRAAVTMVSCSDFQCPFSARARHTVDELLRDNPDLQFFYTHLPLDRIHPHAGLRARASTAAQKQGRFWKMHDVLYDGLRGEDVVDEASAIALAGELGLDARRFAADLRDTATAAEVQRQSQMCRDQGVRAVPTFFINGREVRGALPTEDFQRVIDDVRG